ncbi:glycerophosphodiester phosphodiesterase family protein [Devosia sp. YIM 151766]|uniref:glycerophosphodiester phosphodiesterase family protein n=1 Tax=Devosia sp. YIM 151766 TaxID=3017325 RepID=UPI00255CD1F3|nr:glycerophosphodiester phosphodiesterase family protein [Devosia sp. YIM 151766]WIY51627.1 glycerophosphodiester phosphodiesterase family protein [Devosia sp. YIM 151766]
MKRLILLVVVALVAAIYLYNASWRVGPPDEAELRLIAHRGVHQTFDRADLDNDTCTAERIEQPRHNMLENTLPSMAAAFAAGADIVELDVHPTTDGQFAVMHDWTVDCRTEGTGETRAHAMADLKKLDIGYGYSADNGQTFPFRGLGIGQMPELKEVLSAMPERRFLVNFKSREAREGDMLAQLLTRHPEWRGAIWGAYGGDEPTYRADALIEGLHVWSRRGLVDCLGQYLGLGWTGYIPEACRNTQVMLPINVAPWLWGWPNLLQARLHEAGSEIILLGPFGAGDTGTAGIDDLETLALVPPGFDGYVWTNRIELIGPALTGRPPPDLPAAP